jgi:two-component system OmpR family sensor kinase
VNFRSAGIKLVALYCALLLVLGASFAWFTITSFDRYTRETVTRSIDARASEIWHTAKGSLDDRAALAQLIESRFAPEAQEHFIRISEKGRVLYLSAVPDGTDIAAFDRAGLPTANVARNARYGLLLVHIQSFAGADGRRVTVESGQSNSFAQGLKRSLTQSMIFGLPVLLVLAALGGYVFMRESVRPLEVMIDAAEAITFNDPGRRLPLARTDDRLEALGLALNRMLDRLDNAYQYANRFSVDAAHELRTPLAIIRGELEFISAQDLPTELREALTNMLAEAQRLSEMVENLGMLSRMDSLWGKREHQEFDLHALARETVDQIRLLAEEKDIELCPISGGPAIVAGDRNRLKQVLVNLLDNAIKYTPAGGRVAVEVLQHGNRTRLMVRDTGIGIAPEHQTKIFDRFYRISTDRGVTGSGLGLSVVKAICSAHGGTVDVESVLHAGSTFRIELPVSNAT